MRVNLFYLTPNTYGGWVTYTYHLFRALESVGVEVRLYKIGKNTEKKTRPFGYNLRYRNVNIDEAMFMDGVSLIIAVGKKFKESAETLLGMGSYIVIHDPTEFKNLPENMDNSKSIVIRESGLAYFNGATFIPHPYERQCEFCEYEAGRFDLAVSVSRIDFDKHTEIILEHNELCDVHNKVSIYGFENRLYTRFKIKPKYPNWEQSKVSYERTEDASVKILSEATFHVDMSEIKGDGGGTQYTFLEAWDAGSVNIINKRWFIENGKNEMLEGINCLAVNDHLELMNILSNPNNNELEKIVLNGFKQLEKHKPELIGNMFLDLFNGDYYDL